MGSCADLHREHIEAFKTWLSTHPAPSTGKPLNRVSIKNALINLHCFLTRITEWGYPNPPVRPLMFPGDLPIIDKPLPRFLDDAAAAKLLRATRADPDPLSRLIVELLARTGIRRGELLALDRRRGRADRLRLLAADPDRQTAQRPLHSRCTHTSKNCSTTGSPTTGPPDCAPIVFCSNTTGRSATTASPKPCATLPTPPGSATSPPINCGTPWPRKP